MNIKSIKYLTSKNENNKNNIIDTLIKYIKIFYPLGIITFGILDYITFVDTFHFSKASFLDVYLYNINLFDSSFIAAILLIPFIAIVYAFSINYISTFVPVLIYMRKTYSPYKFCDLVSNIKNSTKLVFIYYTYLVLFALGTSLSINITLYNLSIIAFVILFVSNLLTIPCYIQLREKNQKFRDYYLYTSYGIYLIYILILLCVKIFFGNEPFFNDFKNLLILLYILSIINIFMLEFILAKKTNIKPVAILQSQAKYVLITFIIVVSMTLTTSFMHSNQKAWTGEENTKDTMAMFLNKSFQSDNAINIDINISAINLNKNIKSAKKDIVSFDKNTKYLPISKEIKLYFVDHNDTNQTLVYAVEKKYYKGEYKYFPIDIGYIQKWYLKVRIGKFKYS